MEDLTEYETSLVTPGLDPDGCEYCQRPYPYCLCDDDEDEQTSSSALVGVWGMLGDPAKPIRPWKVARIEQDDELEPVESLAPIKYTNQDFS